LDHQFYFFHRKRKKIFIHAVKQGYIDLSQTSAAATFYGFERRPNEGFGPSALYEILNLKERGLQNCVIFFDKYAENDFLANLPNLPNVRKIKKDLITIIE